MDVITDIMLIACCVESEYGQSNAFDFRLVFKGRYISVVKKFSSVNWPDWRLDFREIVVGFPARTTDFFILFKVPKPVAYIGQATAWWSENRISITKRVETFHECVRTCSHTVLRPKGTIAGLVHSAAS